MSWALPLLAFAALPAAAADTMLGYDTTGFWTRSYDIPRSYCVRRLAAEAPALYPDVISAMPCLGDSRTENLYALCEIPDQKVDGAVAALRSLTRIVFEAKDCCAPPEYPELAYKSRRLAEEYSAIGLSSSTAPGLAGLYDAQMKTLDILIRALERAKSSLLEVYVSTGGRCSGEGCRAFLDRQWESSPDGQETTGQRFHDFKPWRRSAYPACLQVEAIRIILDLKADSPAAEKARRRLLKLGEPYSEPGCSRSEKPAFMVLSRKSPKEIVRATVDLPGLKSWTKNRIQEANTKADDEREDILDRELTEVDLSRAPHLKHLALAERERIKDSAQAVRRLKSEVLIVVTFTGS